MLLPPAIETARLTLRRPAPSDALHVADAIQETLPELREWFHWAEILARYGDLDDMGARAVSGRRRFDELSNPVYFVWQGPHFLGEVLIDNPHWEAERAAELEVWMRRSSRGRGYATEALRAVVAHLFEVQGCELIEARVNEQNAPSRKLFQRMGFQRQGRRDSYARYLLTADEWPNPARHLGVVVLTHPECVEHEVSADHSERPERIDAVMEGLKGLPVEVLGAPRDERSLDLAHPRGYLERVDEDVPVVGIAHLDDDTDVGPTSIYAALRGVGGVVSAVDLVLERRASSAFVVTRPPGHHAEREKPMGFCLFATAAIGALHALRVRRLKRVVLIDIDVHHGNGSQDVLQHEPRILFVSTHEGGLYPHTGLEDDPVPAHILNVTSPSPPGPRAPPTVAGSRRWCSLASERPTRS